jgi:maltooligosyltrehalose trehalohydrolase
VNGPASRPRLGATLARDGGARFEVWAPNADHVDVVFGDGERGEPLPLGGPDEFGYYRGGMGGNVGPGTRYLYRLDRDDARTFADPASRWQPDGVHGPSAILDATAFAWTDAGWTGLGLRDFVLYELHVGTFSAEGTFDGAVGHLDALRDLGVTVIEPMPIGQFPGSRNWGYDGVFPFAAQSTYGGPEGFARLVDACHARGLAVCLDVVDNHLGPEGNVLREFGPYFTDRYATPWGDAVNFDGPGSDEVRRYFVEHALQWLEDFHVDALRLDAVHGIFDISATPFLQELELAKEACAERLGRTLHLIAESDLGDPRLIRRRDEGGFGLDAQWSDDVHHALHTVLTGERGGYYEDFGSLEQLARGYRDGYVYQGEYSRFRRRRHGAPVTDVPAERFVVFDQNHDQVGNRMLGERLTALVDFESLKLAAAATILSPYLPLLFMGEEYGETAPFQYFVSHTDEALVEAVRTGRAEEFASFGFDPALTPDPQSEETFERSRLHHELVDEPQHRVLFEFHRELLRLRREVPALATPTKDGLTVGVNPGSVVSIRHGEREAVCVMLHVGTEVDDLPVSATRWTVLLDSADERWQGPGALHDPVIAPTAGSISLQPRSAVVLHRPRGRRGA